MVELGERMEMAEASGTCCLTWGMKPGCCGGWMVGYNISGGGYKLLLLPSIVFNKMVERRMKARSNK